MLIGHRKEIRKLTFRALALRRSELRDCGLCGCMWFIYNSSIRSDEGLTLETLAFESLYGGQFTVPTQLICCIKCLCKFGTKV